MFTIIFYIFIAIISIAAIIVIFGLIGWLITIIAHIFSFLIDGIFQGCITIFFGAIILGLIIAAICAL